MVDQAAIDLQERVARLRGLADAARASGNPIDLDAVRFELDKDALSDTEVGIMKGFVEGTIGEQQVIQLAKEAQVRAEAPEIAGKISGGEAVDSTGKPVVGPKTEAVVNEHSGGKSSGRGVA